MVLFSVRFRSLLAGSILFLFAGNALAQGSWTPDTVGLSQQISSIGIGANGDLFVGEEVIQFFTPTLLGLYHSSDNGTTWHLLTTTNNFGDAVTLGPILGINPKGVNSDGDLFAGGNIGDEYFRSTDNGNSWGQMNITSNSTDVSVDAFASLPFGSNGTLFIATGTTGLQTSTNDGVTWTEIPDGGVYHPIYIATTPSGYIFDVLDQTDAIDTTAAGTNGSNGGAWYPLPGAPVLGSFPVFASNNSGTVAAGGTSGMYVSTDNGHSWDAGFGGPAFNSQTVLSLAVGEDGDVFAGMSTGGMYLSTDHGSSWNDVSSNLPSDSINALAINRDGILFAGTNEGVFQYSLATGGVSETASAATLTLDQNTPNPVTSTSNIHFSVPESGPVSLRVFDATGREIQTLANGFYAPGAYDVPLDAGTLPNGAYFYRLTSGNGSLSRMFVIAR